MLAREPRPSRFERIVTVLADPRLKASEQQRHVAVRRIAEETFDLGEMARRTLGSHWSRLTDAERTEFIALFGDVLDREYFTRIATYNGETVTVLGDSIDDDLATVRTRIVTQQDVETPVDYRLLRRGDRWVVYDVSIEGVSLVANYRAQFNRIIQTSSYQTRVDKLRSKRG
jgi:phospholipid transport system substrate-binding protein